MTAYTSSPTAVPTAAEMAALHLSSAAAKACGSEPGARAAHNLAFAVELGRAGDPRAADHRLLLAKLYSADAVREAAVACWGCSAALKAEFASAENFAAFTVADLAGRVKSHGGGARRDPLAGLPALDAGEAGWRSAWSSQPGLRAEFTDSERSFVAFMKAAVGGRVAIR